MIKQLFSQNAKLALREWKSNIYSLLKPKCSFPAPSFFFDK